MITVKLTNVSKIYPKNIAALSNINLEVREGEFVSIVGRSGVGKTTLVKLMVGEDRPSSGRVEVLGWEISNLSKREMPYYRRQIGVVFQDFKLLEKKTAYENVAFTQEVCDTPTKKIKEDVPRALALVGLAGKEKRYPIELSGGEKQRLAIARSFVHHPRLLIADELTGELDALYAWEIAMILVKINQLGATVILSTHDRDIVNRLRRRVVTLEDGRIIRDQRVGEYLI